MPRPHQFPYFRDILHLYLHVHLLHILIILLSNQLIVNSSMAFLYYYQSYCVTMFYYFVEHFYVHLVNLLIDIVIFRLENVLATSFT